MDVQHSGNKVDRVGDSVDRDKLSNLSCCRLVAKTGNKVHPTRRQSTLLPICHRIRQQSTFNKVDPVEFNFAAGVYRALESRGICSAVSNNMKFGTLAVDGWAVTFGTARRGLGGARARPGPSSLYQM